VGNTSFCVNREEEEDEDEDDDMMIH